jgi:ABC-type uncharacterized transport system YnjBCD ATPase subunit
VLAVRDISLRFGDPFALKGGTFGAGSGEIVGVIGPNGAGKTTLLEPRDRAGGGCDDLFLHVWTLLHGPPEVA